MLAKFKSRVLSARTRLREEEEETGTQGKEEEGGGETGEPVAEATSDKPESSWLVVGIVMVAGVLVCSQLRITLDCKVT